MDYQRLSPHAQIAVASYELGLRDAGVTPRNGEYRTARSRMRGIATAKAKLLRAAKRTRDDALIAAIRREFSIDA